MSASIWTPGEDEIVVSGGESLTTEITATAGQTTLTLPFTYEIGGVTFQVFCNGLLITDYTEDTTTTLELDTPAEEGDEFVIFVLP